MRREIGIQTLEQAKQSAIDAIDTAAGEARSRYTTNEPGQEALYSIKREEANRILGGLLQGGTPYLSAEASALGISRRTLAQTVKSRAQENDDAYISIEKVRIPAKIAVRAAQSLSAVSTRRSQAIDALSAI